MYRNTFCLCILCIFISCSLIPELEEVKAPIPDELPKTSSDGAQSRKKQKETLEVLKWREFYKSPELQELIELGLKNNRSYRVAALNVEQVRQSYRIQKSALYPKIGVNAGYQAQELPRNALNFGGASFGGEDGIRQEQYSLNVAIPAYELDFFGRIRSLNEAALEEYFASDYARKNTKIALINQIADSYLRLLASLKFEEIALQTADAQSETVRVTQRRFKSGVSSELDLRRAQTQLESVKADAVAASREVALSKNALTLLLGGQLPKHVLRGNFSKVASELETLQVSLSSNALLRRPDIKQAESFLKSSNASIGAARAAFFPSISLTTNVGKLSTELGDLFDEDSDSWLFSPSLNLPIFTGGENQARLDLARLRKETRIAEYELAIQTAFKEAADALVSNEKYYEQLKLQKSGLDNAWKAFKISKSRYETGVDNYLNQLDALRTLYLAQKNFIASNLEYFSNLSALYKVLGGGVE